MRAHRAYLLGCGLALPLLALAAGLQAATVTASPPKFATDVNRALKGDRLPAVTPAGDANSSAPGFKAPPAHPRLPEGCEAAVSAMTQSSLARTPARCIS